MTCRNTLRLPRATARGSFASGATLPTCVETSHPVRAAASCLRRNRLRELHKQHAQHHERKYIQQSAADRGPHCEASAVSRRHRGQSAAAAGHQWFVEATFDGIGATALERYGLGPDRAERCARHRSTSGPARSPRCAHLSDRRHHHRHSPAAQRRQSGFHSRRWHNGAGRSGRHQEGPGCASRRGVRAGDDQPADLTGVR